MILATEVVYKQGLVKTVLCDGETTVAAFAERIAAHGRVRNLRQILEVDRETAARLAAEGALDLR